MDEKVKGEIIKSGNIVLSGFMGSGKTTVGRRLAAALDMQFVDMDLYIEKKTGMTVKEIFAEYGELHFRALETETVKELAQSNHFVIATGGGTLMQPQNVEGFHQGGGTIYYLDVPLAALQERLKNDKRRPLLQTPDRRAGALSRVFLRCSGRSSFFASSSAEALLWGPLLFGGISRLFALRFFNGLAAQGANALYNDNRGRAGVDDDVRACKVFRAALV